MSWKFPSCFPNFFPLQTSKDSVDFFLYCFLNRNDPIWVFHTIHLKFFSNVNKTLGIAERQQSQYDRMKNKIRRKYINVFYILKKSLKNHKLFQHAAVSVAVPPQLFEEFAERKK